MSSVVISAVLRSTLGPVSAKKLRKMSYIPGVMYSKGASTPIALPVAKLPKGHTHSSVVTLRLGGDPDRRVLMREVQVDVYGELLHIDFQEVEATDIVRARVPLTFQGLTKEQEKEGMFSVLVRFVEVSAPLSVLPTVFDVPVSHLKAGDSVRLFDIAMPQGVVARTGKGKNVALASIVKA